MEQNRGHPKALGTAVPSGDGDRDSKGAWRAPGSRTVPGVVPSCATPGKREPTLLRGGPLAPREPRLVFQSRRAGIFSVQQISLMAQRWSSGTLGTLARWQLQGGGFPRGHGGHSLGRSPADGDAPSPRSWSSRGNVCTGMGGKTMWNSQFAHKPGLAGWEACHILLERWPTCRGLRRAGWFNNHPCSCCPLRSHTGRVGLGKYFGGRPARRCQKHRCDSGQSPRRCHHWADAFTRLPAQAMHLCMPPIPWGPNPGTARGTKAAFRALAVLGRPRRCVKFGCGPAPSWSGTVLSETVPTTRP